MNATVGGFTIGTTGYGINSAGNGTFNALSSNSGLTVSAGVVGPVLGVFTTYGIGIGPNSSNVNTWLYQDGSATFAGSVSKGSGSFRIPHPLPELSNKKQLVHSFVEGPYCDLLYRGTVNLVNGSATINIDQTIGMTAGTFVALCKNTQVFLTNQSDWTLVKGTISGNILTINAQDTASTALISWMVVGERQDPHIISTDWTDSNGRPILEPDTKVPPVI